MSSENAPGDAPVTAPATGSIRRPKTTGLAKGPAAPGVAKVDPILVVDGVERHFGGLTAVSVDHLEIPRGAITALIGPNGAGKTTLFNLLCGFDKPNSGQWSFDGKFAVFVGGFPIVVDNEVIGGVGLSGGNGEQDTKAGVAALAALAALLEPRGMKVLVEADIKK